MPGSFEPCCLGRSAASTSSSQTGVKLFLPDALGVGGGAEDWTMEDEHRGLQKSALAEGQIARGTNVP